MQRIYPSLTEVKVTFEQKREWWVFGWEKKQWFSLPKWTALLLFFHMSTKQIEWLIDRKSDIMIERWGGECSSWRMRQIVGLKNRNSKSENKRGLVGVRVMYYPVVKEISVCDGGRFSLLGQRVSGRSGQRRCRPATGYADIHTSTCCHFLFIVSIYYCKAMCEANRKRIWCQRPRVCGNRVVWQHGRRWSF